MRQNNNLFQNQLFVSNYNYLNEIHAKKVKHKTSGGRLCCEKHL